MQAQTQNLWTLAPNQTMRSIARETRREIGSGRDAEQKT
jgi:hypothetical protein